MLLGEQPRVIQCADFDLAREIIKVLGKKVVTENLDAINKAFTCIINGDRSFIAPKEDNTGNKQPTAEDDEGAEDGLNESQNSQSNTYSQAKKARKFYYEKAEDISNLAKSRKELVDVMQIENTAREKKIQLDEKEIELLKTKGIFELELETSKRLIESSTELQKAKNDLEILKIKVETKDVQIKLDAYPTSMKAMTLRQLAVKEGLIAGMSEQELNSTLATLSKKFANHRVGDVIPEGPFGAVYQYDHDAIICEFKQEFATLRNKQTVKPRNQPAINVYMTMNP